jgi:hypothetical protein
VSCAFQPLHASPKAILHFVATRPIVLVNQMLENGIVTMIVSCNTMMGEQFGENFDQRTSARIT